MPIPLTPRQRQALKARAHALEPVVQVGQHGLTDNVIRETDRSLTAHELIKVRIAGGRDERQALLETLSEKTDAAVVQSVGKVAVLWRPRPDDEADGDETDDADTDFQED